MECLQGCRQGSLDDHFNRITRDTRIVPCGRVAGVAPQPILGIWPERNIRIARADPHYFIADGTPLSKRRKT
jgi:hypothetical protein